MAGEPSGISATFAMTAGLNRQASRFPSSVTMLTPFNRLSTMDRLPRTLFWGAAGAGDGGAASAGAASRIARDDARSVMPDVGSAPARSSMGPRSHIYAGEGVSP